MAEFDDLWSGSATQVLPPLADARSESDATFATDDDPASQDTPAPPVAASRRGNRTMLVLAAVALASLIGGIGLSQLILNPAEVAARTAPPAAGLITVPIEQRELRNDVTLRGDVQFDGATGFIVETAELTTRAVVTGQVPEVGDELEAGTVALEIAGRPVIVLPGGLPTFRSLRVGVSGPDVVQLKEALTELGIDVGDPTSDLFDEATAAGVAALYQQIGYPLPPAPDTAAEAHAAAVQRVTDAQGDLRRSERDLSNSHTGPSHLDIVQAEASISAAERQYQQAHDALWELQRGCAAQERYDCGPADFTRARHAIDDAQAAFDLAWAGRWALDTAPDTTHHRDAIADAQQRLSAADAALRDAETAVLPHLPASEVVFLETLPRRVDSISLRRGETVGVDAVMTVSGAELLVNASAAAADAALIDLGAVAVIDVGGVSAEATVTEIRPPEDGSDRSTLVLTPSDLTPEQVTHFRGANVRVSIPVSATGGEVLTVPLAALTAGPGGESRIEIKAADGSTTLVEVTTGLAAGGHVEVDGIDRPLQPGELVVIGGVWDEDAS